MSLNPFAPVRTWFQKRFDALHQRMNDSDRMHGDLWQEVFLKLSELQKQNERILMTQEELAVALDAASEQFTKALGELTAALAEQSNVTPRLAAAANKLIGFGQTFDDLVPDKTEG